MSGADPEREPTRHPMVRWYNPLLLLQTGFRAAIATTIGQISDNRELLAALQPASGDPLSSCYDYSGGEDIRLDYVADLGDGWQATYAVASAISADELTVADHRLPRAKVLVMGGDEIYPDPSTQAYLERTISPYRAAAEPYAPFEADLFALPGNHDWYDGLKAFSQVFMRSNHSYAGRDELAFPVWNTCQARSYFALRLPHGWWLCGLDVQLDGQLNPAQLDYFQSIADELMQSGDRIILCAAKPSWVLEKTRDPGATGNLTDIAELFSRSGAELKLVLAGDLHHYSHYKPGNDGPHLVTSGGGGAFSHPTHKLPGDLDVNWRSGQSQAFKLTKAYPDQATSRRLSFGNLLFAFINWDFALTIGGIYALLAWFLETRQPTSGQALSEAFAEMMAGHKSVGSTLERFFATIPQSPEFAIVVFAVFAGLVGFSLTRDWRARLALGLGHTLLHFVALVAAFCVAVQATAMVTAGASSSAIAFGLFLVLMVVSGALLGGLVFGAFLLFSLNVLGQQWTNAFSSLRIADYKNFLRLRIAEDGKLTVYPLGIEKTGDEHNRASAAEFIEQPFTIE